MSESFDATAIRRPDSSLLIYYFLVSVPTLIAFPFVFIPLLIKYNTLRYKIDGEGVSMAWGFLFRREILLTYRRIQDIHVRRNIIHRWLGLSAVAIQTASGTSGAEMTIEGVREFEQLRDYLYTRMRGARGELQPSEKAAPAPERAGDEALSLLREIRDLMRSGRGES
jgi:putative membrane protein